MKRLYFALLLSLAGFYSAALAADKPDAAKPDPAATDVVVATVGDKPIYNRQVDQVLKSVTHGAPMAGEAAARARAAVLGDLIERRLVENHLERIHLGATSEDIDAEMTRIKTKLTQEKRSLEQFLTFVNQTETTLRAELSWEISWRNYLKKEMTDEAIEAQFKAHQQDFDGTQLRVSHILFRPTGAADTAAIDALVKQAAEVRKKIVAGELDFKAAAEQYSAGPSRSQGGDLGFIGRHGPMVEAFSRAAFALEKDQISEPVVSPSGVHLIRVTATKPGDKKWSDVRDEVSKSLAERSFQQLLALERGTAPVHFTGKAPYFKPGTTEVVMPK